MKGNRMTIMTTLHGTPEVPFSQLFADTVRKHGVQWAARYYQKRGMPTWEFLFWLAACKRVSA
jgi:hypothetical protein